MTTKLAIEMVGEMLYGPAWQERLAEALGVSSKTVWRWKNGAAVPDGVWRDIGKLVADHADKLLVLADRIKKHYPPP